MSHILGNTGQLGVLSDELERIAEHTDAHEYDIHTHGDGTLRVELVYVQPDSSEVK